MERNIKFFKILNLLSSTFKEYSMREDFDLSFEDLLVRGYARSNNLATHSKKVRMFAENLKTDDGLYLTILRTYAAAFHRRELTVFFRELQDYIDFEKLDNDAYWQKLRVKILDSEETISESERTGLDQVESRILIKQICNSLTHATRDKFIIENHSVSKLDRPAINSNLAYLGWAQRVPELFHNGSYTIVNYYSHRLRRNLQFKIGSSTLKDIQLCCANALKGEFSISQDGLEENIKNFMGNVNRVESPFSVKMLYGDTETTYTYKNEEKLALENFYNLCDQELPTEADNLFFARFLGSAPLAEKSISPIRVYSTCFSAFIEYEHLAESLILPRVVKKGNWSFGKIINLLKDNSTRLQLWGNSSKSKDTKFDILKNIQINLESDVLYKEMLLTEIVNILEFFDSIQSESQEVWKDFADQNVELFNDYINGSILVGDNETYTIIKAIRNSIVHLRYITDGDKIYFFDGQDNDNLSLKTTLRIEDVEAIRDAGLKYIENLESSSGNFMQI